MNDANMPGRAVLVLAVAVAAVLMVGLVDAGLHGQLIAEGSRVVDLRWGRALLLDIYAGMALFAGWIAWREPRARAVAWIATLLVVGNVVACAYLLHAWHDARGSGWRFWNGTRARPADRPLAGGRS